MRASYIALAVPFFFVLIAIEIAVSRARRQRVYRLGDAISDLGCGMVQQVALIFLAGAVIAAYEWLYAHHRLVTWQGAAAPWIIAFVGVDFLYYWWHRMSHEVNVLWAAHVVHHQSEDYNLAVALRQAILTGFTAQLFYVWLALLGVPPLVFASVNAVSTLYQFWIHTELVGKLGWVEGLVEHAEPSSRPSRGEPAVPRQELRRDARGLGPPLRHLRARGGAVRLRRGQAARELQPDLGAGAAARGARGGEREGAEGPSTRSGSGSPRPGGCLAGSLRSPDVADGSYVRRPASTTRARRGPLQRYATAQFAIAVITTAALMLVQKDGAPAARRRGRRARRADAGDEPCAPRAGGPGPRGSLEIARLAIVAAGAIAWARGEALFVPIALLASAYAVGSALWLRRAGADALDPAGVIRAR